MGGIAESREDPARVAVCSREPAEDDEGEVGKPDEAILTPLAASNMDATTIGIDITDGQVEAFAEAQPVL